MNKKSTLIMQSDAMAHFSNVFDLKRVKFTLFLMYKSYNIVYNIIINNKSYENGDYYYD